MEVKSRFSIISIYVPLAVFGILFLAGLCLGLFSDNSTARHNHETMQLIAPALVLCFGAIAGIIVTLLKARKIIVTINDISIQSGVSTRLINKHDITAIEIFARGSAGILIPTGYTWQNGTKFFLKNEGPVFIADAYYENIWEIKEALKNNFSDVIEPAPVKRNINRTTTYVATAPERFAGNAFFTWRLLPPTALVALLTWFTIKTGAPPGILIFDCICLAVLFIGIGTQLNYFILNGNQLIIKNHVWWWRDITIDTRDIAEAVIERPFRAPYTLRLTFNNYSTKTFNAASLRKDVWKKLMERLALYGVIIKDEIL
jgi:hypothetical protein